jgi:replicative superfamily II helicase
MPSLKTLNTELVTRRHDLIDSLKSLVSVPLDEALASAVLYGVGFHHAGMTAEEREILAGVFGSGVLRVIVATCSLAAGINLPARRVILHGARMGQEMVGPAMLRQMRGRAGRKGQDELGETYVCCKSEEQAEIRALLHAELPPIQSSLSSSRRGIKRAVLESMVIGLATHALAVRDFVQRTLLAQLVSSDELEHMTASALRELHAAQLITASGQCYEPTSLGRGTVLSGLSPEDSLFVHAELSRARSAFVLDGDMHVFYMFTPVSTIDTSIIDWGVFRQEIAALDDSGLRALAFCGVNPGFVNAQANSALPLTSVEVEKARIHARFYVALQLRDLCNEVPLHVVANKFRVARGSLQSLLQSCQGFAHATIIFCKQLDWGLLAAVLEHMSDRLQAGARADLLELAQIPFVKGRTARVLWENGYKGVRGVAEASPDELVSVLRLAMPWRRAKGAGGGNGAGQKTGAGQVMGWELDSEDGSARKLHDLAEVIVRMASRLWERQQHVVDVEGEV